jgi:transcriptional regulator with XRE-family HTH domain
MPDDLEESFGCRLRRLRLLAGLDASLLAHAVGVELEVLETWERDEAEPIVRQVLALAAALRCTAFALLVPTERPPHNAELLEFLETDLGQAAARHGIVPALQSLQTEQPPTVGLYTQLTRLLLGGAAFDA